VSVAVSTRKQRTQDSLPPEWPESIGPDQLAQMKTATPFLACDLDTVRERYASLNECFPDVLCYYAVKCNSSPQILSALHGVGSGFEVASLGELRLLQAIGVAPEDVIHSNPVKPAAHIAACHDEGVWRYAFDGVGELRKLAEHAPGAGVIARLRVDDSTSVFPLSRKFGVAEPEACALLLHARDLGLQPYGVTFHVGSQCTTAGAWRQAIAEVGRMLKRLQRDGIVLEMLNLSGGFPARYGDPVPSLGEIAGSIVPALSALLPYVPRHLAVEPGRYLVAESAVMVSSVIGREVRAGENWLYLDVGAYNGLIETLQATKWSYPLWSSAPDHEHGAREVFTVTGPTCDSSDTLFPKVKLPASIDVDDRIYIGCAGAYTLSYASTFNGFAPPTPVFVGE
jgi:ornithine decarboxylase